MTAKRAALGFVAVLLLAGAVIGWSTYRRARSAYDAYRTLIQPGAKVAGVPVGWLSEEEARARVTEQVAEPYLRQYTLHYQDDTVTLSPGENLRLRIPVDEMVAEAMAASHHYDYWEGFRLWLRGKAVTLDLDVPLQLTFDDSAAAGFLADVAKSKDLTPSEPMVDVRKVAFIPGRPGHKLEVDKAALLINERVVDPSQRDLVLPVEITQPDQSRARIESMLSTLGPVMERPPTPPSFYTATLPLSSTGGLAGTPLITYTGELTWTWPHFAGYTGPLTSTCGFFFDLGKPGSRFNVEQGIEQVEVALRAGATDPITFEAEAVPPPPLTPTHLIPPLEARLGQFPGVTSLLVKNLDSNEVLYRSNVDYVVSGMSIVKIGIMVEVYRYYGGTVDEQTGQELLDMLGSSSCNPCANRLMAAVGGGSAQAGAQKVTATMRQLGLANFGLCAPFQVVEYWEPDGPRDQLVWATYSGSGLRQGQTPRYDRCVRATPLEMANLVEMIYLGTLDRGPLREAFPFISAEACQEMIDIMAANDLRNMLGSGIPDEVKLAHKHGFSGYDVPWGDTRGEVGIVFSPGATWLISFYIWQDTPWIDWGINQPLYRDVSNMLYNYFNATDPYWPLPPWSPPPEEEVPTGGA